MISPALQVRGRERERRPEPLAAGLDEVAGHLVQKRVVAGHRIPQAQFELSEILLADREGEGVRAVHQVRHDTPQGKKPTARRPPCHPAARGGKGHGRPGRRGRRVPDSIRPESIR